MGYTFYLFDKDKQITKVDYEKAFNNLIPFNKTGSHGFGPPCDLTFTDKYIKVSGSFSMSGMYAEGMVLNFILCLQDLGYKIRVCSNDWNYGTEEDWKYIE